MGWTSLLVCLGLLAVTVGGAGAHVAWVAGESHFEPHGGRRVTRNIVSRNTGGKMTDLIIESEIAYRYVRTTIDCTFENPKNVAAQNFFQAILPAVAFVSGFHIDVGGHRYVGKVMTKANAEKEFRDAIAQGKSAAAVELTARDVNLFTVNVNVQARETVTFSLTYDELLVRRLGVYTHAVHIDPGQIVDHLTVKIDIKESNNILGLIVDPLRPFSSTTQSGTYKAYNQDPLPTVARNTPKSAVIQWGPTPDQQRILKKDGIASRFVVQYDIDRLSHPNQILVHGGYFVHFFAPGDLTPMDKHVVFVLDTSWSMNGTRITQLKQAMGKILSDLRSGDFFTIIEFSKHIRAWKGSGGASVDLNINSVVGEELVVKATADKIQEANSFVQGLKLTGWTNIHDSLVLGLKAISTGANKFSTMPKRPEPIIIFLTDGDPNAGIVTDKKQIPSAITALNSKQTSIFTLGFGKGIDMNFLTDLSAKNNGFSRLIYEGSDAALQLVDFYREVSSPLLKDLVFHYSSVDLSTVTRVEFKTLQSGTELIMSGKLTGRPNDVRSVIYAKSRYGNYSTGFATPEAITVSSANYMERLWAHLSIKQLLEDSTVAGNVGKAEQMALKYSFVTPLTSLVSVRPGVDDPSKAIALLKNKRMATEFLFERLGLEASDANDEIEEDIRIGEELEDSEESSSLPWPRPQFNGTHVVITKNGKPTVYIVETNPTEENFTSCRISGRGWFHCRHVKACILPDLVDDFEKYQASYFCSISGISAGVCCTSAPST